MLSNILIAIGFFGLGFLSGMITAAWMALDKYKKYPVDVVLLFEEYAKKF